MHVKLQVSALSRAARGKGDGISGWHPFRLNIPALVERQASLDGPAHLVQPNVHVAVLGGLDRHQAAIRGQARHSRGRLRLADLAKRCPGTIFLNKLPKTRGRSGLGVGQRTVPGNTGPTSRRFDRKRLSGRRQVLDGKREGSQPSISVVAGMIEQVATVLINRPTSRRQLAAFTRS